MGAPLLAPLISHIACPPPSLRCKAVGFGPLAVHPGLLTLARHVWGCSMTRHLL